MPQGGATGGGASSSTDMSVDPVGPVSNNFNLSLRLEADPLSGIGTVTRPAGEDTMSVDEVSRLIEVWVNEVGNPGEGEEAEESMQIMQEAWDDVNGRNYLWEKLRPRGGKKLGI